MRAILISDDPQVTELARLSVCLRWPGSTPKVSTTAADGLAFAQLASLQGTFAENASPEMVLIHPSVSDMSLTEAMGKLRSFSNVPVVVLGDRSDEEEAITALEAGADDYVRLPCLLTEMMARVWALSRRSGNYQRPEEDRPISSGPLLLNPITGQVFLRDQWLELTATEFKLLHFLMRNRGVVIPNHAIQTNIWGDEASSSSLVKTYVQRVRTKLEDADTGLRWIASIHGAGYKFVGPSEKHWEMIASSN